MGDTNFIKSITPYAIDNYYKTGILPSVTIAQAALESRWGKSGLSSKYNNYFGIKGTGNGGTVSLLTSEFENGKYVKKYQNFRVYQSPLDSFIDHSKLLLNNRYKNVLTASNYKDASIALQSAGYATSPDYAKGLIATIESNNLQKYDGFVKTNKKSDWSVIQLESFGMQDFKNKDGSWNTEKDGSTDNANNPLYDPDYENPGTGFMSGIGIVDSIKEFVSGILFKAAFFIPALIIGIIGIYFLFSEQINTAVKAYATGGASLAVDKAKGGK